MSRKHRSGKRAQRPPDGATWIWHTLDLLDSLAWRKRSIHCRRLIDFLEREHLHHGGNENGNLLATYSQLEAEGISRKSIHGAIQEAEQRGLVSVERGGRKGAVLNELNRFRLTYLWHRTRKDGVWFWYEPTDNWRNYEAPARAIGAQMGTVTVPKRELPTVPKREPPNPQVIEKLGGDVVPKWELPSRFGEGTVNTLTAKQGMASAAHQNASTANTDAWPLFQPTTLPGNQSPFDPSDCLKPLTAIVGNHGGTLGMVFELASANSKPQSRRQAA